MSPDLIFLLQTRPTIATTADILTRKPAEQPLSFRDLSHITFSNLNLHKAELNRNSLTQYPKQALDSVPRSVLSAFREQLGDNSKLQILAWCSCCSLYFCVLILLGYTSCDFFKCLPFPISELGNAVVPSLWGEGTLHRWLFCNLRPHGLHQAF